MDWTETIVRLLPCLLIAGLLGGLIGWLLGRIFGSANATELLNNCQTNLTSRDREISGIRGDLTASTARVSSLQTEMVTLVTTLKTRESWIGEHEEKIKALEADLDARVSELDELKAENAKHESALKAQLEVSNAAKAEAHNWRTKLSEVEVVAQSAKASGDELIALKTSYAEKEQEFAKMSFRMKSLEALPAQLKEKDDQITKLTASHASVLEGNKSEILRLGIDVAAIGGLTAKINSQGNKIQELEGQLHSASNGSEAQAAELGKLRDQLEASGNNINGLEKELAVAHAASGDKEAEIARLQGQVGDLEALGSQLKDRDSELAAMRLRVGELESLQGQLDQSYFRVLELEKTLAESQEKHGHYEVQISQMLAGLNGKDSELSGLMSRIALLEPLGIQLTDRDTEIAQLRLRVAELEPVIQEVKNRDARLAEADTELVSIRKRLVEFEKEATVGADKAKNLEANYQTNLGEKDKELAGLTARLGEITVISGQLKERENELNSFRLKLTEVEAAKAKELQGYDARIKEFDAKLQASTAAKDAEIGKLNLRITELSPLTSQLNDRDGELVALRKRLVDLEKESATSAEKTKGADANYQSAITNKDGEIARLTLRIGEIGALTNQLKERETTLNASRQKLTEVEAAKAKELQSRDARIKELDEKLNSSLSAKDSEIGKLNLRITQLSSLTKQLADRDGELVSLRKRLVEVEKGSIDGAEKTKSLEASYRTTMSNKDSEIARLNLRIGEIITLSGQLNDRDGELVALRKRLVDLEKSGSQASAYEVEIRQLRASLSEMDALTKSLQERDAKLSEWDDRYNTSISERDRELSKLRARITELEMMSREVKEKPKAQSAKKSSHSGSADKDDLKLIFGIGPVLERLLNEQGIYFFRDIGTWAEKDIRHYDHLLEDFRGRIERDDWVSGAKEEHLKKYGEALQ